MSYVKQNFKSGQVLKADHLNHMEDGIAELEQQIKDLPSGDAAELTIGTVTGGETASASIEDGKLNLVLPRGAQGPAGASGANGKDGAAGAKGDKGDTGPAGPGFSDSAKGLILSLFEGAAYGNDAMKAQLTALKTEWNAGTEEPDTPPETEDIPGETPVYKLAQAAEFTPAKAQCIDTGIKLFESIDPKPAYTILFEVQYNESLAAKGDTYVLLHCMEESSPWPGLTAAVIKSGELQLSIYGYRKVLASRADLIAGKRRFAVQFSDEKVKIWGYDGSFLTGGSPISSYTDAVSKSLILGAYQQSDGAKGRYFDGTLYQCLVYNKALDSGKIVSWITG